MHSSKIAFDFLFKLDIHQCATVHGITKAEVVKAIFNFFRDFPNSSYKAPIKRKLKEELCKRFYKSPFDSEHFAKEYGMDLKAFRKFMKEIINDADIIHSDYVADSLFRKLMTGTAIVSKSVPKRIVRQIANIYVCDKPYTQDGLASIYGTRRETIAVILKRAIAENIVDDVTAEKIIMRIRNYNHCIESYALAFEERAKNKATQS